MAKYGWTESVYAFVNYMKLCWTKNSSVQVRRIMKDLLREHLTITDTSPGMNTSLEDHWASESTLDIRGQLQQEQDADQLQDSEFNTTEPFRDPFLGMEIPDFSEFRGVDSTTNSALNSPAEESRTVPGSPSPPTWSDGDLTFESDEDRPLQLRERGWEEEAFVDGFDNNEPNSSPPSPSQPNPEPQSQTSN